MKLLPHLPEQGNEESKELTCKLSSIVTVEFNTRTQNDISTCAGSNRKESVPLDEVRAQLASLLSVGFALSHELWASLFLQYLW